MSISKIIKIILFTLQGILYLFFIYPQNTFSQQKQDILPPDYEINDISFKYLKTESFDKNSLLDIMTLPKKKIFNHEDLEKDQQILKKYYFDNGYFNAIIDTSTEYDDENMSVNITIIILEKNRYSLNNIKYSGLDQVKPDVLDKIKLDPLIKKGMGYERSSILLETGRILDILQNNGYPFARIDTTNGTVIEKSNRDNFVNIELSFLDVNKQYYFGKTKINITKNIYNLPDQLIRRELDFKEGALYNKSLLIESERNFTNFSIIQSGRIQIDSVIENESKINFVVNIILTNKYEITPSLIGTDIDNQFYVGAGLDYSDRNFFGGGRVMTVGLNGYFHSKTVNLAELKASLFQPFFLNNSTTATYELRFGFYNFTDKLQYVILRNLFRVTFTLPTYTFYKRVFTDLTADLIRSKTKIPDVNNPSVINTTLSNQINSVLGLTLVHDNTNDIFNPSKGFYHTITAENGGLLPKLITLFNKNLNYSQYLKLLTLNKFYRDVSGRSTQIVATFNRIGDIIEYGKGSNIVPIATIYKFFSGGSSSVRGWNAKENGIVPDPEFGGNFIFEGSLEYRWHTFADNDNFLKNIWLVYFFDYGNIWEEAKYFRINEISLAIGTGIRYNTFVGPLRLDFGFRLYDPKALSDRNWLFDKKGRIFADKFAIQFGIGNAY